MHKISGAHGGGDTGGSSDDDSLLSQWSQSDDIHVVFWDFRWAGTSPSTVFFGLDILITNPKFGNNPFIIYLYTI